MVCVDNTDREIIDTLVGVYGGSVVTKKKREAHHRQCWTWRIYGAFNVKKFLIDIRPYMRSVFKRERADMLIHQYHEVTPRNGHYTAELREAKELFEKTFMDLGKGRGSRAAL
jgi:hypothetical protein